MPDEPKCAECGALLPQAGPCVQCLLQVALDPPAAAPGEPPLPAGSVIEYFGDYLILQEIARGGMGVVYQARQLSLNRLVALKMILGGQLADEAAVRRFQAEAEAAANLAHPHIVPIHEIGQHQGRHYFSMELVEGGNLAEKMEDEGWKTDDRVRLLATVARAVHHAHQRGILHRDLKPSNILIDPHGQPHITDFGLARRMGGDGNQTLSGVAMGTPNYMAPEQVLGRTKQMTTGVDVWALGVILYQLLTRRLPFKAETGEATWRRILEHEPVRPGLMKPGIDRDLETICLKCLEKEAGRRYPTAEALAEDLERWLRQEPIVARPIGLPERALKWVRRRPAVAAAAASLMLVLALAIGLGQQARQKTELARRYQTDQAQEIQRAGEAAFLRKVDGLFDTHDSPGALAELTLALRLNPSNRIAAERLVAALTQRRFPQPALPPFTISNGWVLTDFARSGLTNMMVRKIEPPPEGIEPREEIGWTLPATSLHPSGTRWVTLASRTEARIQDARTQQGIGPPLVHAAAVTSAQFSPDGAWVATTAKDRTARVWRASDGQPVTEPLRHGEPVAKVAFSSDGERLCVITSNCTAQVWNTRTGARIGTAFKFFDEPFAETAHPSTLRARFSPDGRKLMVHYAYEFWLWDVETGQCSKSLIEYEDKVYCMTFSPDSRLLVTACIDGTGHLWDARTGERATYAQGGLIPWLACGSGVDQAIFSPDSQCLVLCGSDEVQVWNVDEGILTAGLRHPEREYVRAIFDTGGGLLATLCGPTVRVWDMTGLRGRRVGQKKRGGGFVTMQDITNNHPLFEPIVHGTNVQSVQFSPAGDLLQTVTANGAVQIWDLRPRTGPAAPDDGARLRKPDPVGLPVPEWLPDLAEAVAGIQVDQSGARTAVAHTRLFQLRRRIESDTTSGPYAPWARSFLGDLRAEATWPQRP